MTTIKSKRFVLRSPKMSDAKDVAKNINNWKVIKNLSNLPFPYELKHAKEFIGKMLRRINKQKPTNYLMYIEIDGEVVGAMGAHHIEHGHKAEIGYWLAEKHWGKGIMTEALKLFMKHIEKEFKLKRIHAYTYPFNKGSMRVLEKVGMKFEGIEKKGHLKGGKFLDGHRFAKVK